MSDLKVKLSTPSQTKVVLNDNGTPVTITAMRQVSTNLSQLGDVNTSSTADGSILVYDQTTNSYKLTNFLVVDGETVTLSGGDF